jgi:hypothetical protein
MKHVVATLLCFSVIGFVQQAFAQTAPQASQGCYVPSSGVVYVIGVQGAPTACAQGHTLITLQGPKGDTGAQGPAGVKGEPGSAGPPGSNGVSGWELASHLSNMIAPGATGSATAMCPSGKRAMGGGYVLMQVTNDANNGIVVFSGPNTTTGEGWSVSVRNPSTSTISRSHYAYAICAFAT